MISHLLQSSHLLYLCCFLAFNPLASRNYPSTPLLRFSPNSEEATIGVVCRETQEETPEDARPDGHPEKRRVLPAAPHGGGRSSAHARCPPLRASLAGFPPRSAPLARRPLPRPERPAPPSGEGGGAQGACARPAPGAGGGEKEGRAPRAASRSREPRRRTECQPPRGRAGRGPRARARTGGREGLGADATPGGGWLDPAAGDPRDPRLWKLCAGPHTCSRAVLASSGQPGGARPRGLRRAPSSPPDPPASPALGARPPAAPGCGRRPGPAYRPSGSLASILWAPLPSSSFLTLCTPAAPWSLHRLLTRRQHPPFPSLWSCRRPFAFSIGFWCIARSNLTFSNAKYST